MNNFLNPFQLFHNANRECAKIFEEEFSKDFVCISIAMYFSQEYHTHFKEFRFCRDIQIKDLNGDGVVFNHVFGEKIENFDLFSHGIFELKYRDSVKTYLIKMDDEKNVLIWFESDNKYLKLSLGINCCTIQLSWKHFPNTFNALAANYKAQHQQITITQLLQSTKTKEIKLM